MKIIKLKSILLALAVISTGLMSACGGRRSGDEVIVAGSTSVQPYAEILAEEFDRLYPGLEIDVQGGGSSAGITAVESEVAHIGMSSRELKEKEQHLRSVEIAKDGLALIVHPDNPVSNLTLEQVRDIYAKKINNWKEVGGDDHKIHIITREEGSGTRSAFEELVMGEDIYIAPQAIVLPANGAVRQSVSSDKYSIGYISLGFVEIGENPVKAVSLGGVSATRENVINGSYNLFRPFLFVTKYEPEGAVKKFIDFVLSPEGQRILSNEGLIPE